MRLLRACTDGNDQSMYVAVQPTAHCWTNSTFLVMYVSWSRSNVPVNSFAPCTDIPYGTYSWVTGRKYIAAAPGVNTTGSTEAGGV